MQTRRRCRELRFLSAATVAVALVLGTASMAAAVEPPVPSVTGPVTGGAGDAALLRPTLPADSGYVTQEYFLTGDATAYASATPLTTDGKWKLTPAGTAPYATRMVVIRPSDPKRFNGTVYVEWLNVSAGFDTPATYLMDRQLVVREGAAWVGVSAQAVGVQGSSSGTATAGFASGIKAADPERYASLSHPGDSYSYDIFTQAGRAIRGEGEVKPLGDLTPKRLIATGESQSASRMVTYIDGVNPLAPKVWDGFLVHSRFGGGAALTQAPLPDVTVPNGTVIRTDVPVPVLMFETESDVGPLGGAAARQPDTRRIHTWEVAGTSHSDAYGTLYNFSDPGDGSAEVKLLDVANATVGPLSCATPINAGPHYAVLMAAVDHLDRWVRTGTPPRSMPRFQVTDGPPRTVGATTVPTYVIARDADGIAVGGIRTAFVDAPRARIDGENGTGPSFCRLFGNTIPFDAATLAAKYPSKDAFLAAFRTATEKSVKAGVVLPEEAKKQLAAIQQVPYPGA